MSLFAESTDAQRTTERGVTPPSRRGGSGRRIPDVLVELGFVDLGEMDEVLAVADSSGQPAERLLIEMGRITPEHLARATAERFGLDYLELGAFALDPAAATLVAPAAVMRYQALPVAFVNERTLLVAMVDPANVLAVDDIAVMTGYEVRPAVTSATEIAAALARLARPSYGELGLGNEPVDTAHAPATPTVAVPVAVTFEAPSTLIDFDDDSDDSVIGLVHRVVKEAAERGASDIHYEPFEHDMRIRYRIDGVLVEAATVALEMVPAVISRIKILSDMDIAERRLPQDGRMSLDVNGNPIDVRVVTLPSSFGENVVMRILDQSSLDIALEQLGMLPQAHERFVTAFSQSYGAVLVTGPTGSGKSTSLYAALNQLNTMERNIITIEDPVEYNLEGVTQVQVNKKAGLTFASGLRAMMRADPDVIMVGEIRDRETAQLAVEAALTGHLVLSTLHTNDAPTAITRLVEMGIEPFLVASSVDCVVAQRLARKLCTACRKPVTLSADVLNANGFQADETVHAYEPHGCARCAGTGYKGRIGLYEVMYLSERIRSMAIERQSADAIAAAAVDEGMIRLREDGIEKVRVGLTSIAEVARVAGTV